MAPAFSTRNGVLLAIRRWDEVGKHVRLMLDWVNRDSMEHLLIITHLGQALLINGKLSKADEVCKQGLSLTMELNGENYQITIEQVYFLAKCKYFQGERKEAVLLCNRACRFADIYFQHEPQSRLWLEIRYYVGRK